MNKRLWTCVALFAGALSLKCAQPQMPAAPAARVSMDRPQGLVQLDVTVSDAAGNAISGLGEADFHLLENGSRQKILSFQAFDGRGTLSEPPAKIILMIDTIELQDVLARQERLAVITYLRQAGDRLGRAVSVFLLTDTGMWSMPPSSDGRMLADEIEHNHFKLVRTNAGHQTGPLPAGSRGNASDFALQALGQIATGERRRPGRKLLLWVGPGWGIGSGAYADAAQGSPPAIDTVTWFSALLREAHLVLYSFTVGETDSRGQSYKAYLGGVTPPRKASLMNVYRKVLAVQSGGRVMDDNRDLVKGIESCLRDDGPFYRISFDPLAADHDDEYHDLKVVVDWPGSIARTNTGYYDQPYYSAEPFPPPRRLSLKQLQQLLTASHGASDADLARQLSGLTLTERLSERRLSRLDPAAGKRSRQELRIMADASAFLDPPADEKLTDAAPDLEAQNHMLSLTSTYLSKTIGTLPDLFASRTTVRYQDTPTYREAGHRINYPPLHVTDSSTTAIRYRNGYEITETKLPERKANEPALVTYGAFGPALQGLREAIDSGGFTWSRWEQGAQGRVAVFHHVVTAERSDRELWLCCLPDGDGNQAFLRYSGYHEEIAIDPGSGAILRLTFQHDLKSTTPIARSDLMIEYGPVDIGGKSYICPLRSVSVVRARSVRILVDWDQAFMTYGPFATLMNEISFDHYHMFRSESHLVPDYNASP